MDQERREPLGRAMGLPVAAFVLGLLAVCILFSETIGPAKSIFGRDTVSHDYGMLMWAWQTFQQTGSLPLWNPYLFGGIPTLGTFAVNPFNLQTLLLFILPFPLAFTFHYLVTFAIGCAGMALLLRRIGCNFVVSILIGIVFSLSGHFTTLAHAGHLSKAMAFAWVPWLFWLAERWIERPSLRRTLAMSIPLAMMMTASHLQITYLAGFFLCVWLIGKQLIARAWQPRQLLHSFAMLMLACVFASILASPQLLPGLEMARISNRSAGITHQEAARTSYPPAELIEYIVPGWFGTNAVRSEEPYRGTWGAPMNERIVSDYFGVLALALAGASLFISRNRQKWIWLAIALIGVWIGIGVHGGLWQALRHVPGFSSFRSPAVAMGWTTIGALVLTGIALQALLDRLPQRFQLPILAILAIAMIADVGFRSRLYVASLDHNDFTAYLNAATPPQLRDDPLKPVRVLQKGQELTNAFMASGVGSLHGYHPVTFQRYDQLIRRLGFYDGRISSLFHQNWYLWPAGEEQPAGWHAVDVTGRGLLLEREVPAAYVTLPRQVRIVENSVEALEQISADDFNPSVISTIEGSLDDFKSAPGPAAGQFRVTEYAPNRVVLEAQVERPGIAIFADLMGPGWMARMQKGSQAEWLRPMYGNGAFRALNLPAGEYTLQWLYRPLSFRIGLWLALAGWSLLVAMAVSARRTPKPVA